jgi:hypothetical protein
METPYVIHGRDGRDGRDGPRGCPGKQIIVMTNQIGPTGEKGFQGEKGIQGEKGLEGPTGPSYVEPGKGLFNTNTFSFVSSNGQGGQFFEDTFEIINTIQRKDSPISYIGLVWSSSDLITKFTITLRDVTNTSLLLLSIGPSANKNAKNMYEIYPCQVIATQNTRILKMTIEIDPGFKKISIYSVTIGYN